MGATYRIFRGSLVSWDQLLQEAAEFASSIGKDRMISISHSEDANDGVVVVWYWDHLPSRQQRETVALSEIEREIEENQQ
ncbi:MAG: hypothetical protein M3478_06740 [Planctomycetota bacterium]|nr:hypothetical protein [Planctomycetota bacterium]